MHFFSRVCACIARDMSTLREAGTVQDIFQSVCVPSDKSGKITFHNIIFCQVGPSSRETCCCCYKAVLLKAKQRKNMVLSTILTSVQYRFELRYVCTTGKEKKLNPRQS